MLKLKLRTPGMFALATLVALGALTLPAERAMAQSVGGKAFGTFVNASGVTAQSPVAALPETGGYALGEAQTFGVPNTVDAQWLTAVTTGDVDNRKSNSQSTSELEAVSVLNGLVSADNVTAIASSYRNAAGAGSNADGSGFVNLVVNGVPVTTDVAPNTRVTLPGAGYAVLNEQTRTGDGVTSSGITVNMIHVVLQQPILGLLGQVTGYEQVGEIVVGSASSRVN